MTPLTPEQIEIAARKLCELNEVATFAIEHYPGMMDYPPIKAMHDVEMASRIQQAIATALKDQS